VTDAIAAGCLDLLISKSWAIKLATEAVCTILSIDQIIVARQAGGTSRILAQFLLLEC